MLSVVRSAAVAAGLVFALSSAGCASFDSEPAFLRPAAASPAPVAVAVAPPPEVYSERAPALLSNEPEDFVCLDGSWIHIGYSEARDTARVSVNGATPIAMRRADEQGLTSYRAQNLVLHRSGPRVVVRSEANVAVVRSGDTLGTIALRHYGDRLQASRIAGANADQIDDPNLIFPGQVLRLPAAERQCRRALQQAALAFAPVGASQLSRRAFSPPSSRMPDLRAVRASSADPDRR